VGALFRILILEQYYKIPIGVATLDIDIAVTVIDWEHYEKLRDSLLRILTLRWQVQECWVVIWRKS